MPYGSDEDEYRLLTQPGASLTISLASAYDGLPRIHVFGNREGMLSLANVLLWLRANGFLQRLGLAVHRLACFPEHGHDLLPNARRGDAWVWLELESNRPQTEDVNSA
jgi:hypothetical protein